MGGQIDQVTVERLVNAHFDVIVKPSGTGVFVDKEGREVNLYLSVDALTTGKGKEALVAHRKEKALQADVIRANDEKIEDLLAELPQEEIIQRLSKN